MSKSVSLNYAIEITNSYVNAQIKLERVRELHQEVKCDCGEVGCYVACTCGDEYPCPTVLVIGD
jgi:hypothetical protein